MRHRGMTFVLALLLAGCRQGMYDQPKFESFERNPFFADHRAMRPQAPGTVARGQLRSDRHFYTGFSERRQPPPVLFPVSETELERTLQRLASPEPADTFPFPVAREHIARGRERFEIFCAPCHGLAGAGDGIVVQRGFRPPPSYHLERLRQAPPGHFFDVVTRGVGAMSDLADRIPPADRWAITAYIRALQLSQWAPVEELPKAVRDEFRRSGASPRPLPRAEIPPVPRLQTNPAADYEALRRAQQARLESFGWVDPGKGIVHLPIARAIDILLERGLPVRSAGR